MSNFTLGQKIKLRRKELGLTQKQLAGDVMTRNMLSLIESDKAMPSFPVCEYLAAALRLPLPFLFSGKDDLKTYQKNEEVKLLRQYFSNGSFELCIKNALTLDFEDDEINLIITKSAFELGKSLIMRGSLQEGIKYLSMCEEYSKRTIYSDNSTLFAIRLYKSIGESFQSPMLDFDKNSFENEILSSYEIDFYKYLTYDLEHEYKDGLMRAHIEAKRAIKSNRYIDAKAILEELIENKSQYRYNAFIIYSVYSDIESVYRQLLDFESAYRFSSKRISLLNAFNA